MKALRKKLGYIKRGMIGWLQNHFEKVPPISKNISSFKIGKSADGKTIQYFKIGNGSQKLLYTFGIHGNEMGTIKLAHHFTQWVHKNKDRLNDYTLFIIPCLNPDGYQLAQDSPDYFNGGKIGRFNGNNVDLGRNFDTPSFKQTSEWCFGKDYSEKIAVSCGKNPFSEPETRALTHLIKKEGIKIMFMFHNAGSDVLGNKIELAQNLAKLYSEKTGFRLVQEGHWKELGHTGTAVEWCDLNDVAYIEIEGSTRWGSDWKRQKEAIEATLFASNM